MKLIYQVKPLSILYFLKILQETIFSLLFLQNEYKRGPYHLQNHHTSFWEDDNIFQALFFYFLRIVRKNQ